MTETKRDLTADLVTCSEATEGPWYAGINGKLSRAKWYGVASAAEDVPIGVDTIHEPDARFIAEARTGWPDAIKRAMAAEGRADHFEYCALEAVAEVERLREALETIVRESSCHGVDCTWGPDCFGVIAHKALYPEVTVDAARKDPEN